MSHRARFRRIPIVAALAASLLTGPVFGLQQAGATALHYASMPAPATWRDSDPGRAPARTEGVRMADADCSAAAAEAAAETGGQVLSVSSRDEDGRTVCVVTVLVPGEEGERPRKRTITVPQ